MTDQQYDADCSTSKLLSATLSEEDEEPFFRQSRPRHSTVKCLAKYCLAAFLCIAAGAMVGYYSARLLPGSLTIACSGINSRTPIPRAVFTNRLDVPFIPNREFMGPSQEADRNWARITEGSDSIYLHNPSQYGLEDPGIRAPFFIFNEPPARAKSLGNINNFYVLNSMHQLHCVHNVRKRYNQLVYLPNTTHPLGDGPLDMDWITHLEHCFEYLRLSIMCGDYMTLESDSPPGSPEEYWKGGLSWGVVHSCIDWERLVKFQRDQVVLYNSTWS